MIYCAQQFTLISRYLVALRRVLFICAGENTVLTKHRLESYLSKGRNGSLIFLDTVASTNTLATQLARRGTADGTAVIANCQTKGSGRLGRSFYSPGDIGVYFSYVKVLPEDGACSVGLLTSLAALAVCGAIDSVCHFEPRVKWPNDILVGGKKVCGILTNLITDTAINRVSHAVIGIGINVNHNPEDFPEELAEKAGSLKMFVGQPVSRERLCAETLNELDRLLIDEGALLRDPVPYVDRLTALSCTIGNMVRISTPKGPETVLALGLTSDGGLIVDNLVERKVVRFGEVETI